MDVTDEKLRKLLRRSRYVVLAHAIHALVGVLLLLPYLVFSWGAELFVEWLYGSPGTWYMRLSLYVVKGALLCAHVYVFLLFLARSVAHAKRDS